MKSAVFDIEATDLAGIGAGSLLLVCVKPVGKPVKTFRLDDLKCRPGREKKLVDAVFAELSQYDLLIGHNIDRYDWSFLRTRAYALGAKVPNPPLGYDTLQAFKRTGIRTRLNSFGKPSAGLAMVCDFFGFEQEKTAIYPREWWEAIWGNQKERRRAMDEIEAHCRKDVAMNEKIYQALLPIDANATIKRLK